ncbi:endo-1,4-beta-xylanase [Mycoplana ramosa]|uniref:Beta-xylanase n=1 Tax=Mycoplana ramosa TaxID=40837 RepID=A0ABW3Z1F5_MYCRA
MRRREFVAATAAATLALLHRGATDGATAAGQPKIPFGAAVRDGPLQDDEAYRQALVQYCQLVVGEGGLKWVDLRPDRSSFDFHQPDRLLAFARQNGMKMRGHTLAWYAAMPEWTNAITSAAEAERELTTHIETVVGRYRGEIPSWDVVNEPLSDDSSASVGLRDSVWAAALGERYVDIALRTAHAVDPRAQLVINDYGLEAATEKARARRLSLLDLVRRLRDRGTPLDAVGFQAHLPGDLDIDTDGVSQLVADLKSMDIEVLVTELDVIDDTLPAEIIERDAIVARRVQDLLGAILSVTQPTAILTWGLTDRYTWVPIWYKRGDGKPNRPLPLTDTFEPKPMMQAIQAVTGG